MTLDDLTYRLKKQSISFILMAFLVSLSPDLISQIKDNINWTSIKISEPLSDDAEIILAPIVRFDNNLSSYANSSIDLAIKYGFWNNWHMQLLSRTWFIPDQPGRQFIWLDLGYRHQIKNIQLASHFRIHYALDINQRKDSDYLRWKSTINLPNWKSLSFHVAIEPWLRLNEKMQLQRMRYEPGVHIRLSSSLRLTLVYRKEDSVNILPYKRYNMYLVVFGYKAPWIW